MQFIKKLLKSASILLITIIIFSACSGSGTGGGVMLPTAVGKMNQVFVVADNDVWESPVGDTLRYYFASPYLILPRPESIFDIKHYSIEDMRTRSVRKELRTYVFLADLADEKSPTTRLVTRDIGEEKVRQARENKSFNTTVGKDKWARGQMLIYQFGFGKEELMEGIKRNFPAIRNRINEFDRSHLRANTYQAGEEELLQIRVNEKFETQMKIPADYTVAIENEKFMWLRKDLSQPGTDVQINSNILIYRTPYTRQEQISEKGLLAIRDSLGKKYITSDVKNSFMRSNTTDLPAFTQTIDLNGNRALETRGIWELENDFMGGSFISYLVHNADKKELLFVDGFLYAPGTEKRDLMQQLEYIFSTIQY